MNNLLDEKIKFSILIPTRDRKELLQHVVLSVLRQKYANWELIISDNSSNTDNKDWIDTLEEQRIVYYKQPNVVSVTDNWNTANNMASGDYIIMLGDDDALTNNALEILYSYITSNNNPELLVFPAYLYCQENVDPNYPKGYVEYANPITVPVESGFLSETFRKEQIENCLKFHYTIGFNMQYYCYSKSLVYRLEQYGAFYEPPYPDYYTSCMMFLVAETVFYLNKVITILGVTPKSYGYYYRNNIEKEGMEFHKEADYREYAPEAVRSKLCSVDEIHTAAMATFSLIPQRIDFCEPSLGEYYKCVIEREAQYRDISEMCNLLSKEIFPHLEVSKKKEMMEYFLTVLEGIDTNKYLPSEKENTLSFHTITDLINEEKKVADTLARFRGNQVKDLYVWLDSLKVDILKELIRHRKVLIWGAYERGRIVAEWLQKHNIAVEGFVDKDNSKTTFLNFPVYVPKYLAEHSQMYYVMIPLQRVYEENLKIIEHAGYRYMRDYLYLGHCKEVLAEHIYQDAFGNTVDMDINSENLWIKFLGKKCKLKIKKNVEMVGKLHITVCGDDSELIIEEGTFLKNTGYIISRGKAYVKHDLTKAGYYVYENDVEKVMYL